MRELRVGVRGVAAPTKDGGSQLHQGWSVGHDSHHTGLGGQGGLHGGQCDAQSHGGDERAGCGDAGPQVVEDAAHDGRFHAHQHHVRSCGGLAVLVGGGTTQRLRKVGGSLLICAIADFEESIMLY